MIYTYIAIWQYVYVRIYKSFVSPVLHSLSSWPMYHHVWKDSDSTNNKEALHSTNLRHILRFFHYKTNHSLKVNGILAIHRCSSSWMPGQHSGYQIWQHLNVKTHGDLLPQPSRQSTAFRWKEPHSVLPQGDVALKKGDFETHKKNFLAG